MFVMENTFVECANNNYDLLFQTSLLRDILHYDLGQTVIDRVEPTANINASNVLFTG